MRRLEAIERIYGAALSRHVEADASAAFETRLGNAISDPATRLPFFVEHVTNPRMIVSHFAAHDPTRNKSFTQWMVQSFMRAGFRYEDLPKVRETLEIFIKVRARLPLEVRDIGRYRKLADLWKVVKPFVDEDEVDDTASGHARRRAERDQARAESTILHEGEDGFTVAVPLTEFASKWWGRGTRWCTAADKRNMFAAYNRTAPLVVIVLPGGQKLQMWDDEEGAQFMNEDDDEVSASFVAENWNHLEPLIRWKVARTGEIDLIPRMHQDRAICLAAVTVCGNAIRWIDPRFLHDREIRLAALSNNGYLLKFIPEELKDRETCLVAVRQKSEAWALGFIGTSYIKGSEPDCALHHVPVPLKDREMLLDAVKTNGTALVAVPSKDRDRELCLAAVEADGDAIQFVPPSILDREICLAAISKSALAMQAVPSEVIDRDLVMTLLKTWGGATALLGSVAKHYLLDPEILRMAVVKAPSILGEDFLREAATRDIWLEGVKKDLSIFSVPEPFRDYEMWESAKPGFYDIRRAPEEFRERLFAARFARTQAAELALSARAERVRCWEPSILDGLRAELERWQAGRELDSALVPGR